MRRRRNREKGGDPRSRPLNANALVKVVSQPRMANVCVFHRAYVAASLTYTSADFSIVPQLALTDGYTELTALFDQFRITEVVITLVPQFNVGAASSSQILPYIYSVNDFDGGGPTTATQFLERGMTPVPMDRVLTFCNRTPTVNAQMYESGVATAYSPVISPWLDCGDPATPHYGTYFLMGGNPTTGWTAQVYARLTIEFRFNR